MVLRDGLRAGIVKHKYGEAIQQMESALALYKGYFLAGIFVRNSRDLETWLVRERERLSMRWYRFVCTVQFR